MTLSDPPRHTLHLGGERIGECEVIDDPLIVDASVPCRWVACNLLFVSCTVENPKRRIVDSAGMCEPDAPLHEWFLWPIVWAAHWLGWYALILSMESMAAKPISVRDEIDRG